MDKKIYLLSEAFYTESVVIKAFLEKPSPEQLTTVINDYIGNRIENFPPKGYMVADVVENLLEYDYSKDSELNHSTIRHSVTLHLQLVDLG